MTDHMIVMLKSFMFIGMYLMSMYLFIPKGVKFWRLWKETGKPIHLSNAIGSLVAAFFLLSADFIIFIRDVGGFNV